MSHPVVEFLRLTKPRLSSLVIATLVGGMYLAPPLPGHALRPSLWLVMWTTLGTMLIVGAAHTFNMYLERDSDALMRRTRNRPLPSGALRPAQALWFGVALMVVGLPMLWLGANLLTAALGLTALVSYVFVYTPMKRRSPAALLVGTIPGAIPPLMGWTAVRGYIELPGLLLFAVMFFWQIPHFLAIALYSSEDYARGGIRVTPLVHGAAAAKREAVVYLAALVPVSLALALVPVPGAVGAASPIAGYTYFWTALVGGVIFFAVGLWGLREEAGRSWARWLFLVSLVYLTALFVVLGLEGQHLV